VALVLGLALLAARAGYASLALMSPGGNLLGWSITPPTVCVLCGVSTGTVARGKDVTPAEYAAALASKLSLNDEIGQMLVAQWVGPGVTPDALQMINQQNVGGVLLKASNGNVLSVDQIQGLTAQVQSDSGNGIPLIVSTDQEGGCCGLNRLQSIAGPLPGAQDLNDTTSAYNDGAHTADLLHQYGFNLNLAPVVDVCQTNQSFCFRTFGSDPAHVAALAGAYVEGLQSSGTVTACLKHFPGLGAASGNPDLALPYVYSSRAQWDQTDLAPYRALLASENIRAIMVTHVMIPAVDKNLPASLSPAFITNVLRNELGFTGAIITDDLWDISQYGQYSVPQAAVLSVKAGTDILIGAYAPGEKSGGATVGEMRDALTQAIQSGQISRQRIDDAVTHILTLKIDMGLIQMPYHGPYPPRDIPILQGSAPDSAPVAWVRPRGA
jgi:beta-N-acetylhexosaminidase